jgi:hypothetical protein
MSNVQIQTSGLVKRFGDRIVLHGIDLGFPEVASLAFWDAMERVRARRSGSY